MTEIEKPVKVLPRQEAIEIAQAKITDTVDFVRQQLSGADVSDELGGFILDLLDEVDPLVANVARSIDSADLQSMLFDAARNDF